MLIWLPIWLPILIAIAALAALFWMWSKWRMYKQADYIRTYMFPPGLLDKLAQAQPHLGLKERQIVARALRQFFLAHLKSGCKFVAMPSQVVDDLWHEFILYTRNYESFCKTAFGQYMHHTPAIVLGAKRTDNMGLRRIWWYACIEENINPRNPTRLPLLFALDEKMKITNGFHYQANCKKNAKGGDGGGYCGSDFSSTSFDGSTDGFGDAGSGPV